jgi:NAD(P)-dependent dehydrogenase (short-subunit alcohol dehydrogenase family)
MQRSFWQGKRILVTGGTSGLGLGLVRLFLSYGCNVIATGRNPNRVNDYNENYTFVPVDFSVLENVASVGGRLGGPSGRIDVIINNAGVLGPPDFTKTIDGFEYSFQVNFLSHLLLDEIIIINSKSWGLPVIVSVTSPVYRFAERVPDFYNDGSEYKAFKSYSSSKLALVLLGIYLSEKFKEDNLRCFSFNPGTFSSGIYRMQKSWFQKMYSIASPFMRSPMKAAHALAEILDRMEIISGAIYSSKNRLKILNHIDKETIDEFMTGSYSKIQPYIRCK